MSYQLGVIFIIIVAIIWAISSVLAQYIYFDLGFQSPFLLTYITTSLFSIYIPLYHIRHKGEDNIHPKSHMFKIALIVAPFWLFANCFYNYSLLWTSVSSSTIISNLSGIFTLAFASLLSLESFTIGKLGGTFLSFFGVVIIAIHDTSSTAKGNFYGDFVAIIAAAGYGMYTVALRYLIHDDSVPIDLVLGYMGLIHLICLSPIALFLVLFHVDNADKLSWTLLGIVVANGLFDQVISDYIWARAVVLTSPTVATVGMSITIPLAILSDLFIHTIIPTLFDIIGSLLVITGFVLVTSFERILHKEDNLSSSPEYSLAAVEDDDHALVNSDVAKSDEVFV